MEEEMTISIKDLCCRIFLRWRMIIIWMFIGALVLNMLGFAKSYRANKAALRAVQSETDAEKEDVDAIADLEKNLSKREREEVNTAVASYRKYREVYQSTLEYCNNSVRMQLDPNNVPTMTLQYLIDNHYEAVYPVIESKDFTSDIINSYTYKITNTSVCESIAKALEWDVDIAYVKELITSYASAADVLTINVVATDQDTCEQIASVLQTVVESETAALKELYGDFDISLLHKQYYEGTDTSLLNEQQTQSNSLNNLKNALNNVTSNMTESQKEYYYALLDQRSLAGLEEGSEDVSDEESTEIIVPDVKVIHLRYILLGLIVGAFLACVCIVCCYLLTGKLRVKGDMEDTYGVANLGSLHVTQEKKRFLDIIDRWIISLFYGRDNQFTTEERIRMICAGIRITAQKASMASVYLTGTCNDEETEQMKVLLCEKLQGDIQVISCGKSVVYDPESLECMVAADGVVLVERVDHSRYDDLKKEIELCRQQQIPIIGSVVLD